MPTCDPCHKDSWKNSFLSSLPFSCTISESRISFHFESLDRHSSRKFSRHLIFIEARAGRRRGGLLGKKVGQHWHSEMESEVSSRRSLFQGCPPPPPEAGDANYSSSCEQFVQPIYLIGLGPLGYLHLQRIPLGRVMWDVGN